MKKFYFKPWQLFSHRGSIFFIFSDKKCGKVEQERVKKKKTRNYRIIEGEIYETNNQDSVKNVRNLNKSQDFFGFYICSDFILGSLVGRKSLVLIKNSFVSVFMLFAYTYSIGVYFHYFFRCAFYY